MPRSDVLLAVFGAATGLAGLTLVFLGIVVTTYQSFPGGTPVSVIAHYQVAAKIVLASFLLGLFSVGVAVIWLLLDKDNSVLYWLAVTSFLAEVLALALVATAVTFRVMR